jgi:4-hydroxy-4-methyl-2-oxoglutarate aldolase
VITERPLLTIRRKFPRPEARSVARFAGAATVHLVDAMGGRGALGHRIKAVSPAADEFAGTALTCYAGPDDTLAILAALELAQPGDVIVAATEGFQGSAVVGDLFAATARTSQVAAIVTDGLARDSAGIAEAGLPVFASGVSPNSAARSGPGTVGLPVDISGVLISPGDVVVGDQDGVVVVRQDDLDTVHEQLEAVRAAEASYPTGPDGEVRVPDYVRTLLESEQVRYLD